MRATGSRPRQALRPAVALPLSSSTRPTPAASSKDAVAADAVVADEAAASSRAADQDACADAAGAGSDLFLHRAMLTAAAGLTPLLLAAPDAAAGNGEFGILEGRTAALLHPLVMGGLFAYTLYAGYLGWQWRSVRTVQDEINELKKQQAPSPAAAAGESSAPPPPPSPVDAKIAELTEYRKQLVKGGFRDRHFNAGSILLAFGVTEAVGGALNTWFRTGKLFPGPHLFAGAGITVLWAAAAALVPAMQKGNETARTAHIAINVLNVGLFLWQIPTGWEIVGKVLEFTSWP